MAQRQRHLAAALLAGAVLLPLAACETSSIKSSCDTDSSCRIEITGNSLHDLPRPLDASHGYEKPADMHDTIHLDQSTEGGPATVELNADPYECSVGESFTVIDTTFACTEIGEDSIALETVRN